MPLQLRKAYSLGIFLGLLLNTAGPQRADSGFVGPDAYTIWTSLRKQFKKNLWKVVQKRYDFVNT